MMRLKLASFLMMSTLAAAPSAYAQDAAPVLTIQPGNTAACPGETIEFRAQLDGKPHSVAWTLNDTTFGELSAATGPTAAYEPEIPDGRMFYGPLTVTASTATQKAQAKVVLASRCETAAGGDLTRLTIGFEQVGAAGTTHDQKYSFSSFISRPLPLGRDRGSRSQADFFFGPALRWWGDVRIGSYPQQVNSDIATFAKNFATEAGKTPVNKLVQTAEFSTGLEYRLGEISGARHSHTEPAGQRFVLAAFAGAGAIGPFEPGEPPTVFRVPAAPAAGESASPQYQAFRDAMKARGHEVTGQYVAFQPARPDRFAHTWDVGVRLYTFFADPHSGVPLGRPPASVEVAFGQNRLVTNKGTVWRASAAYPFPLGDRNDPGTLVIYFYGDVVMKVGKPEFESASFVLEPATDAEGAAIPLSHPQVSMIPTDPNDRDTYRIGVSVDLVRIWKKLNAPAQ